MTIFVPALHTDTMTFGKPVSRALLILFSLLIGGPPVYAQFDPARDGIDYFNSPAHDPISRLQSQLDAGEATLEFDDRFGYLPSLLKLLDISPKTQALVFSKTSFQEQLIDPRHPRAIYFNDEAYVGYVQQGDMLEISTADPQLGGVFYTLRQESVDKPQFTRDAGTCLNCHANSRTQGIPGHLVRSLHVDDTGRPHFDAGTFTTNHASPLEDRFGGWYVTGRHGTALHMGNATTLRETVETYDRTPAANRLDLAEWIETDSYLTPHSDIVAQMVLAHQTDMHNWITRAHYDTRRALLDNMAINHALDRPADHLSDSTRRRIENAGERLLEYLLFVDEAPLPAAVSGTSGFAAEFAARGPRDAAGRSLREFDLEERLFKYRCSYLIYSDTFQQLPAAVLAHVYRRLDNILRDADRLSEADRQKYEYLVPIERKAIHQILTETLPNFPPA